MKYNLEFFRQHKKVIVTLDTAIIVLLVFFIGWKSLSRAQTLEMEGLPCSVYPCKETFIITAYYSPLPDQEKYTTGSFEAEKRLEGNGTNGADGTPVYAGMIAAPKIFPFGMKIAMLGGVFTVHDRGGGIVAKGERGFKHHRLDIWMGKGDQGRKRALFWGRRTVEATLLGIDPNIKDNINLENFMELEDTLRNNIPLFQPKIFKRDFGLGDNDREIIKLQQYLLGMNYYYGAITGQYDEPTRQAVQTFQLAYKVIDSPDELGAGYLGPMTRKTFDQAIADLEKGKFFTADLGKDSEGEIVRQLQNSLKRLGYFQKEVNGKYDADTIDAIYRLQKEQSLISGENDPGAGYFGPKTRDRLQTALLNVAREEEIKKKELDDLFASNRVLDNHADLQEKTTVFNKTLAQKETNDEVKSLQEELRRLGYFRGPITGFFGPITEHALLKFQQAAGLIEDQKNLGAGLLGPKTRDYINKITAQRLGIKKLIAYHREESAKSKNLAAKTDLDNISKSKNTFLGIDLRLGDRGQDVVKLQQFLIKQGFLDSKLASDYFGEKTQKAVLAWQIKQGIISSAEDHGAGRVGPRTRETMGMINS